MLNESLLRSLGRNREMEENELQSPLMLPSQNTLTAIHDEAAEPTAIPARNRFCWSNLSQPSSLSENFCQTIRRFHEPILIFCIIIFLVGSFSVPMSLLIASTDSTMHPIPQSYSSLAIDIHRRAFVAEKEIEQGRGLTVNDPMNDPILVLLSHNHDSSRDDDKPQVDEESLIDGSSPLFFAAQNYSLGMQPYIQQEMQEIYPSCSLNNTYHFNDTKSIPTSINVTSFYSLKNDRLYNAAQQLASNNGTITIIHVAFSIPSCIFQSYLNAPTADANSTHATKPIHNAQIRYNQAILALIQTYTDQTIPAPSAITANLTVSYTGMQPFRNDMHTSLSRDIDRMHYFILPLAMLLFSFAVLRRIHYVIIIVPIVTVGVIVTIWRVLLVWLVSRGIVQVTQFTIQVNMTLTFGLGVDYALFLLSRYFQQIETCLVAELEEAVDGDGESAEHSDGEVEEEREVDTKWKFDKEKRHDAIVIMIQSAGHTIIISGITLMSTFCGLWIMKIYSLRCVSVGAVITIMVCMVVNIVIVPALLYSKLGDKVLDLCLEQNKRKIVHQNQTYELEGRKFVWSMRSVKKRMRVMMKYVKSVWKKRSSSQDLARLDETNHFEEYTSLRDVLDETSMSDERDEGGADNSMHHSDPVLSSLQHSLGDSWLSDGSARVEHRNNDEHRESCAGQLFDETSYWYRLACYLVKPKQGICILVAIIAVLLPISIMAKDLKTSISLKYMLPVHSSSFKTSLELQSIFGKGTLSPYHLIVSGVETGTRVDTSDGFQVMQNIVKSLEQPLDEVPVNATLTGIAWANKNPISFTTFQIAKECTSFWTCPVESLRELSKVYSTSTNDNNTSTLYSCILSHDPFTDIGIEWLEGTRKKLKALEESGAFQYYEIVLEGGASVEYDAKISVRQSFPSMVGIVLTVVTVFLAFFFRSITTPLRSVVTIALTLSSAYGILSIASKYDWFRDGGGEVSWLTVILSFNMIVGLAIDYDVFLMNRIVEARLAGDSHSNSIIKGVCTTGNVITAAGCIMAVSFGGLLMSDSSVVREWSLTLTTAVLIDTFVMRSCVVPILIARMGDLSWWPRQFPTIVLSNST